MTVTKLNNAINNAIFNEKIKLLNGLSSHLRELEEVDTDKVLRYLEDKISSEEKKIIKIKYKGKTPETKKKKTSFYIFWMKRRLQTYTEEQKKKPVEEREGRTERMKSISKEWNVLSKWHESKWNENNWPDFKNTEEYKNDKSKYKKEKEYWNNFYNSNKMSFDFLKIKFDEMRISENENEKKTISVKTEKKRKKKNKSVKSEFVSDSEESQGGMPKFVLDKGVTSVTEDHANFDFDPNEDSE